MESEPQPKLEITLDKITITPDMIESAQFLKPDLTLTLKDGRIVDVFIVIKERKA